MSSAAVEQPCVQRCVVLKKEGMDSEGEALRKFLVEFVGCTGIERVRTGVRYDIDGATPETFRRAQAGIFAELPVDDVFSDVPYPARGAAILIESLPGQYDQRSDSAEQCMQLLTESGERLRVKVAKVLLLEGDISPKDRARAMKALINPVDSREASAALPTTLRDPVREPEPVPTIEDFCIMDGQTLQELRKEWKLTMTDADLTNIQTYFRGKGRDPTEAELRVLDMYWSDHCRHTTFTTELTDVRLPPESDTSPYACAIREAYRGFLGDRASLYQTWQRPLTLMDMARFSMEELHANGRLEDLDVSDENNAASIIVPVAFEDGRTEEWLFMFKNETHNHPTEIEGVGGAATALGGVIRDPLSGRTYVFMGVRLTGSGDPCAPLWATLPGRLPQRLITTKAAEGYSGYGNQIGVPTLQVREAYHKGFRAKRFECGCTGGAAPRVNVVRRKPESGDVVLLVGGRTGRDGIGGATGSSKSHTGASVQSAGAEVQKGNPPGERKLQRLFANPAASRLIKKCNDFGAGGVANAVGELADGLTITLDAVPLKYQGMNATEIALSESQERMAVVVAPGDVEQFRKLADSENLEATPVATVTSERELVMRFRGQEICRLDRDLLDSGWAKRTAAVEVTVPDAAESSFRVWPAALDPGMPFKRTWERNLESLRVCSQRGLQQRFDSTVGANTVVAPYGGRTQTCPSEAAVSKFPVEGAITGIAMSMGYDPDLSLWSPYHGGTYAVVDALARIVASGGDYRRARLTLQNYFERLGDDPERWGKVLNAQLGAREAQKHFGVPAIGGKDSMSGTFIDEATGTRLDVPPVLAAFAVASVDARKTVPSFFQEQGNAVMLFVMQRDAADVPHWDRLTAMWERVHELMQRGRIHSCSAVHEGGAAAAVTRMCLGNMVGISLMRNTFGRHEDWFVPQYGSLVVEMSAEDAKQQWGGLPAALIGFTRRSPVIQFIGQEEASWSLDALREAWEAPLDDVFPRTPPAAVGTTVPPTHTSKRTPTFHSRPRIAHPKAVVPVFPGTNCEYETVAAIEREGARVETPVFTNLTPQHLHDSVERLSSAVRNAQILVLAGGFSAGDEPDGSGKFIASVLRSHKIRDTLQEFLDRGGLILGICNGFQGLIKASLIPKGRVDVLQEDSPTLAWNMIGHYLSRMSRVAVRSRLSPWLAEFDLGEEMHLPVAHGEGRIVMSGMWRQKVGSSGQVAFQYVDHDGKPTMRFPENPNGSMDAVAGLTDPTGRILGLMPHPERAIPGLCVNIPGDRKGQRIFKGGVGYFA